MQQPPQQIPIFVPYFNQPRVVQQQDVPQQIVYSEQQQQQLQQPSIYPQAPLLAPEQPVVQQEPVQQQAQCPFARGACQRGRCCKRVDAKKALKLFAIIPLALYIVNYLALVFRWVPYRYTGSYSTLLTMAIISTIVAAVAIRKSSVALLGVFIGMTVFSILAGVGSFIGGITVAFYSFMGFLVAASEVLIGLSKIASVIAAAKLLKKIRAEMSLPQFVEQQAQQEEAAPQAQQQVAVQQVSVPVVQEAAPQQPQPQQHVAPMYPAFQNFQAPTIPMVPPSAPIVQQPVQFATELKLLNDMGFTDAQKNMELLQKHNGSLQAVVMSYVQA